MYYICILYIFSHYTNRLSLDVDATIRPEPVVVPKREKPRAVPGRCICGWCHLPTSQLHYKLI